MPDRPTELGIASWNIHSCIGTDGRFAPDRVARVLEEIDADVVGLQEVGWHWRGRRHFDQFAFLAEATGRDVHAAPVREHADAHFGNALLTRLPVLSLRRIDLTVPFRAPRGALDATLGAGRHRLRVLVVHLGLDPWERRIQLGRLVAALDDGADGGRSQPTLLMGDFNEWRVRCQPLDALAARLPHLAAPRSFHARRPLLRFDRIYASAAVALGDAAAFAHAPANRASDHLPVTVMATLGPRAR